MTIYVFALLIGVVAGLCVSSAPLAAAFGRDCPAALVGDVVAIDGALPIAAVAA